MDKWQQESKRLSDIREIIKFVHNIPHTQSLKELIDKINDRDVLEIFINEFASEYYVNHIDRYNDEELKEILMIELDGEVNE